MNPTLEIPIEGGMTMSTTDLPPGVANHLMTRLISRSDEISTMQAHGVAFGVEALRLNFQTRINEVGVLEGRAVSGVNASNLGGPANSGK